jgi:hypothetical protein
MRPQAVLGIAAGLWLAAARVNAEAEPGCADDGLLSQAAAELVLDGKPPVAEALSVAARAAGSDAVGLRALWLPGAADDDARRQKWLASLAAQADAPLSCGEAVGSDGRLLLAVARGGSLEPISAQARVVRGRLSPGFGDAELVIHAADGQMTRLDVSPGTLLDGVPLSEELELPARVQLLARGGSGPRPVAERVVGDADALPGPAPRAGVQAGAEPVPVSAAQAALRRLRGSEGKRALRDNALLSRLASKHAERVCQSGRIVHELAPGEDPESRLREEGVVARRVGETVARSGDLVQAFDALTRSPSHRMTLLEPGFTDAGFGSASDATGKQCLVVLLAAWPRYVGR